jgi:hypothetical protein
LVLQYTNNRTDSLKEMTAKEYIECCKGIERLSNRREVQRKLRSCCLKLMQQIGVDTSDWARINNFCAHPRIAGKEFAFINNEELQALSVKLRAIKRQGGLKKKEVTPAPQETKTQTYYVIGGSGTAKAN